MHEVSHDRTSRLDFVEGVRSYNYSFTVRSLIDDYPNRVAREASPILNWRDVRKLYESDHAYLMACGVQRVMQQLGWTTAAESVMEAAPELRKRLEETRSAQDCGTLTLDDSLEFPEWYTEHTDTGRDDIHLVPGGYWQDPLVGEVYDLGGSVYRLAWRAGYDARPGALEAFVNLAPPDARRVLDLGCSFGGLTRVFARLLPNAEVIGIDLSAAALTYAHMVSEQAKVPVHFRQADAERTGYEDSHFDVVTAFLLLHEVPTPVRIRILQEAYRILRPGGTLMFLDIPPYSALSPVEAWFESFDDRGNGENFWSSFLDSDFPAVLSSLGFTDVTDGPLEYDEPGYWGSAALWRTGKFNPVNRWVTTAKKPTTTEAEA